MTALMRMGQVHIVLLNIVEKMKKIPEKKKLMAVKRGLLWQSHAANLFERNHLTPWFVLCRLSSWQRSRRRQ